MTVKAVVSTLNSSLLVVWHVLYYVLWSFRSRIYKQSGFITHKQAEISYIIYGVGDPVVLLHGGLSNRISWFSQIPCLVKAGRQVIMIDTRGHGRSTLGPETLTYRLFAEDTVAVLDALQIQCSDVVGWSDGGVTALVLGRFYPDRLKRIVAISANISSHGLTEKAQSEVQKQVNTFVHYFQAKWTGSGNYFPTLNRLIRRIWASPILLTTDLNRVTAPVLFVVGEKDVVTIEHSTEMAELVKNGHLLLIKRGGHATHITHAHQLNNAILGFLPTPIT